MYKSTMYAALGVALTVACPVAADDWIKDTLTGCEIFMADNDGKEKIAWSGDCVDGKASGTGVLVVMNNSSLVGVYAGNAEAGRSEGKGRMTLRK